MTLFEKAYNFLRTWFLSIFSKIENDSSYTEESEEPNSERLEEEPTLEQLKSALEYTENAIIDDKVKVVQLTLTRLYMLSQKITIFKESFPDKYKFFEDQIKELEKSYKDSLISAKQNLTFEIDPEKDGEKLAKISKLENDVETFIEKEVKFGILIQKLQNLIVKLNILYNVSVTHTKPIEKEKILTQTIRAIHVEDRTVQDFKCCEYLLGDMRLKDKIVGLISYLDYQIFKLLLRNSDIAPNDALKKLAILNNFDGVDYNALFEAFLEDELNELVNLIEQIQDEELKKIFKNEYQEICTQLIRSKKNVQILNEIEIWFNTFSLESNLFSILKESGIEKDKIKIKLISRMDIHVTEKDVLISPKSNTYLNLLGIFSKTKDQRITLFLKLLQNISNDVTYKEIYFLLLLFDILDVVKENPNELIDDLEKYLKKYPYSNSILAKKKEQVLHSSNRNYVYVFTLEEYEEELIEILEDLKFDFKDIENQIYMNQIYFSGLDTVVNSLKAIKN